jgi:FdhE protein
MAGGFLRKILGRSPPLSPEVQAGLADLEQIKGQRPALSQLVDFFREVLPLLAEDPGPVATPPIPREQAAAKIGSGTPLLRGEPFMPDAAPLRRRCLAVAACLEAHHGGGPAAALVAALRQGRLDPFELSRAVLAGDAGTIPARADALGLLAGQLLMVLRLGLWPVLTRVQAALAPVRDRLPWQEGYCPVCGAWPLLGEFRGLEQLRVLRCGLCAAGWDFPRLRCPFCGTSDHQALGYFHVEGEEARQRTATCETCRGYVKMVTSLQELGPVQLLVADVTTAPLDLAAAERGFFIRG